MGENVCVAQLGEGGEAITCRAKLDGLSLVRGGGGRKGPVWGETIGKNREH